MCPASELALPAPLAARRCGPRPLDAERAGDHLDRLYRAAWALTGSRHDAEDLVQETYARVLARPRFLRGGDELGYLLRVLRNTYLTALRTASRRPRTTAPPEGFDTPDERAELNPAGALEDTLALELVAGMPERLRDVIIAVDLVGLSYEQASRALRLPGGTVRSRVFRARQALVALVEAAQPA